MQKRRVLLYGKSWILGAVGASLKQYPHLEIVPLAPPLPEVQQLRALSPTVVIFDLGSVPPEFPFWLLREQPDLVLIGMDAAGDKLLLLPSRQAGALTTDDLVQVLSVMRIGCDSKAANP